MFPRRWYFPVRHGRASARLLVAAVLAAAGGGMVTLGRAAEPGRVDLADVGLARAALTALDADPALRDFNLVVSVVDRVAVVGGPVGSAALKDRAAAVVGRVPGVRSVRNACFVQAEPEPLLAALRPAARPPLPPAALPPKTAPEPPAAVSPVPASQPADEKVAAAPPVSEKTVVARRPVNPGENVLLPPVAAGAAPAGGGFAPYPTPSVLTGRSAIVAAVEEARRSEPRYGGLRVAVDHDGGLTVTGAARAEDIVAFANRLRAIPGVTRVVVGR